MGTELAVYDKIENPLVYAEVMGRSMAKSGMFGLPNEEAGMIVAMTCLCERIDPLEFGRKYHIINGRPSMKSDRMLADFRAAGGKHKIVRRDPEGASVELTIEGESYTSTLTWEEAKEEDFTKAKDGKSIKENYAYPRKRMQMLWARVISDGVRVLRPEIVAGTYTPEEAEDMEPLITSAPTKVKPSAEEVIAANAANAEQAEPAEDVPFEMKEPADKPSDHLTPDSLRHGHMASSIEGMATQAQIDKILEQFAVLVPGDQEKRTVAMTAALAKRGVAELNALTKDQAAEISDKLAAKIKAGN